MKERERESRAVECRSELVNNFRFSVSAEVFKGKTKAWQAGHRPVALGGNV